MNVDFSSLRQSRKPTKKEAARYRNWVKYLRNSRLTEDEIHRRAAGFASRGEQPPKDDA